MRFLSSLVFALFSQAVVFAQIEMPSVPPSPNSSALIRHTNIQVGHYTGVPNVSIPLGEVPGKNISLPISLNYHASGIKVQDVASSYGLGWSLMAGGSITRVVRGLPDGAQAHCQNSPNSFYGNAYELCDGERDIFYFNMPGRSGQMFLGLNGAAATMPYQDLAIQVGVGPASVGYWSITDEKGYKYFFGEAASQREETTYYNMNSGGSYVEKYTYISTWFLTRIHDASGIQIASFNYTTGNDYEFIMYNDMGRRAPGQTSWTIRHRHTKIKVKQAKYLSQVSTAIASASFFYSNDRQDLLGSLRLNAIQIYDQSSALKRRYDFVMDYFSSFGVINDRLRLRAIRTGLASQRQIFEFDYNQLAGVFGNPPREDKQYDHFGYYNVSCASASNRLPIGCAVGGVLKTPGPVEMRKVFSLNQITDETGTKTIFEYDPIYNRGLRVKSITKMLNAQTLSKSTFTYSEPEVFAVPIYNYFANDGTEVISSTSFNSLFDLNGAVGGHDWVTETFLDGSKIIRGFTTSTLNFGDDAPSTGKYFAKPPNTTPIFQGATPVNGLPFSSATTRFWMRGLPRVVRVYDSQNKLLKKDSLMYSEGPSLVSIHNNSVEIDLKQGANPEATYMTGIYFLNSRPVYLVESHSFVYDQNVPSNAVTEVMSYTYHGTHKTLLSSVTLSRGGTQTRTNLRYPIDVAGNAPQGASPQMLADGIRALVTANVLEPVERVTWFRPQGSSTFKIIKGELGSYRRNPTLGTPLLHAVYTLDLSSPIAALSPEATLTNNQTVFSFDSRYRVTNNFSYNEASATVSAVQRGDGTTLAYQWQNGTMITASVLNPGASEHKTEYIQNSIDGVLQTKDQNLRNAYVQYDEFGRVLRVRDHDNKMINRNRYHVKGESASLKNNVVAVQGCLMTGQSINFSSPENTLYGETTHFWDFGNGATATSTSGINYTYNSPGQYWVKVKKENPDYYSTTADTKVQIRSAITSFTGYIQGQSYYDICSYAGTSTTLFATIQGDAMLVVWEYSFNGGSWTGMSTTAGPVSGLVSSPPPPGFGSFGFVGSWNVKCTITDACGTTYSLSYYLENYASDPMCNGY